MFTEVFMMEIERTIMQWEGGATYTNDPDDAGGETKYGISKRFNPDINIKDLTLDQAVSIAKTRYWDALHIDGFAYPPFRWKLFDIAYNQGVGTAQAFIGLLKKKKDTQEAVWELATLQMKRYANKVVEKPTNIKYIRGWTNRAMDTGEDLI